MADIAAIFHWPLGELRSLTITELIDWHGRAIACWNRMWAKGEDDE
jgi:hypothetical protein